MARPRRSARSRRPRAQARARRNGRIWTRTERAASRAWAAVPALAHVTQRVYKLRLRAGLSARTQPDGRAVGLDGYLMAPDKGDGLVYSIAVFDDRESYVANADSHTRRSRGTLLAADPEWADGTFCR